MRVVGNVYLRYYVGWIKINIYILKKEEMTTDKSKRTPCEIWTRVMGYLRPVSHYNTGKKSEFYSRKYFLEKRVDNSSFINKYGKDEWKESWISG